MNNHNSLTSNCVQKLVIIDSRVSNYWELIAGVLPNTMVLVLDDNQDSIDQISNVLQSHNSIESLHLVAHGAPGQLFLGNNTLQAINLDYLSGKIAAWSQSLTQNAQILLYGCEAGAGNIGRELVEKLHSLTDRLVAAASKPIGLTAEIVNWDLDIRSADFQPSLAFQGKVLAEYPGTLAEPYLVRDLSSGNSRILANGGTNIGNTLYFSVGISTISSALLKTDGTENGTFFVSEVSVPLVKDSLLSFNDSIYFVNRSDLGRELWKTDGISTALLKDIVPGNAGSNPQQLTRAENKFFFTGTTSNSTNRSLFVSDGTPNGTAVISSPFPDIPRSLTSLNDKLIFVANDPQAGGENNYELWVSDGVNTSLLKDINGNPSVGSVNKAVKLTKAGNYIYFNANPGGAFEQLWKTDGTAAGTVRVKNFSLFSASIDVNGTLFGVNTGNIVKVNADDSSSAASVGGLFPFDEIIETDTLQNVNGTLFFTTKGRDPSTGNFSSKSLWKSDGTQVGTTRIKQDTSGLFDSLTRFVPGIKFSALGNKFYFAGQDQVNGEELWVSDGTAAGTKLVRDINPGSVSSNVEFVGKAGDKLYFSADNGQVGRELWAIQDDGSVTAEKPKDGVVTGGDPNGRLLNSDVESRRDRRNVGFEEIKNPQDGSGQTWVVIHGWNSSTGETNINELIQSIQGKVGANDRVLALNWQEAAANTSGLGDNLTSLAEGANARAATWITPVAEFAVRTLQERYGIDAAKASTSLNLVGHSLGSLLSSDIGRIYRDGGILVNPFPTSPETANTAVAANGGGVRTITALDPASALNLPLNGFTYDLDGRIGRRGY
jgi:ELWxxDGT repeat protein